MTHSVSMPQRQRARRGSGPAWSRGASAARCRSTFPTTGRSLRSTVCGRGSNASLSESSCPLPIVSTTPRDCDGPSPQTSRARHSSRRWTSTSPCTSSSVGSQVTRRSSTRGNVSHLSPHVYRCGPMVLRLAGPRQLTWRAAAAPACVVGGDDPHLTPGSSPVSMISWNEGRGRARRRVPASWCGWVRRAEFSGPMPCQNRHSRSPGGSHGREGGRRVQRR